MPRERKGGDYGPSLSLPGVAGGTGDLQFRVALAIYNKQGGEFETAHTENGVSRSYGSEGIPQELLLEVTPMAKVTS